MNNNAEFDTPESILSETAPLRLLIVEDELLVSLFLEDVLKDLGHVVTGSVDCAAAAFTSIEQESVDLALIDIGLRGGKGDGIDVAIQLRQKHGIPSLMMSGHYDAGWNERLAEAAPLGHLQKPYTQADVEHVLHDVCGRL